MSIIRVSKRDRFVIIDKTGIEDARLSFRAVGLLAYLLCKPDEWTISYRDLAKRKTDGEHSVREGLKELAAVGYLKRERCQNNEGHWGWEQVLYESPENDRAAETTARDRAAIIPAAKITALSEEELSEEDQNLKTFTSFSDFWSTYPSRNGIKGSKKNALVQWKKLSPEDQAQAVALLPQYVAAANGYLKHAERYLRHKIWEGLVPSEIKQNGHAPYQNPPDPEGYKEGVLR